MQFLRRSVCSILFLAIAATFTVASGSLYADDDAAWEPGDPEKALPGLIPAPAEIPGLGRWQVIPEPVRGYVKIVKFSPDGRMMAFADGRVVRIHSTYSLKLSTALLGHRKNVHAIDWSPDGKWIATAGDDQVIRLWQKNGKPGPILEGHTATVRSLCWHPEGKMFASASFDGTIRFWNADGTPGIVIKDHDTPVHAIHWSPDGKTLAAGDQQGNVRLWNIEGEAGPVMTGHVGPVTDLEWSPDGNWLASCDAGPDPGKAGKSSARLWKPDGEAGPVIEGHGRSISALCWQPDSQKLVTAGEDRVVNVWDINGKLVTVLAQGRENSNDIYSLDWHPNKPFCVGGGRFAVRFFSPEGSFGPQKLIRLVGSKLHYVDWSPAGGHLAIGVGDGTVRLWSDDLRSEKIIEAHPTDAMVVRFRPDGKQLASIGTDRNLKLWSLNGDPDGSHQTEGNLGRSLSWTSDGKFIAACFQFGGQIQVFSSEGPKLSFAAHNGQPLSLDFSPDGEHIASGGSDGKVQVVKFDREGFGTTSVFEREIDNGDIDSMGFSPDGKWLASGHNTTVHLWTPDGKPGPVIEGFESAVMRLDWSPDSQLIATGSWDTTVKLWNVDGTLNRVLPPHAGPVWGVSFSPDGSKLLTSSWDGVAQIIDTKTGQLLNSIVFVADTVVLETNSNTRRQAAVSFSPAGEVLSGNRDVLEARFVYLVEQPSGAIKTYSPSRFFEKVKAARESQ